MSALCLIYFLVVLFICLSMYVALIYLTPLLWPSAPFCNALWFADGATAQLWQIRSSFQIVVCFFHVKCVNMSSVNPMAFSVHLCWAFIRFFFSESTLWKVELGLIGNVSFACDGQHYFFHVVSSTNLIVLSKKTKIIYILLECVTWTNIVKILM